MANSSGGVVHRFRRSVGRALAHAELARTPLYRELDARLNLAYLTDRLRFVNDDLVDHATGRGSEIRFSIVVPTYGIALRYVRDLVRSLRMQTHRRWELCVCDDGDPSPEVLAWLTERTREEPE